jgi:hypothetical protein
MVRLIGVILALNILANALEFPYPISTRSQCMIPDSVLDVIQLREGTKKRKKGYEFVIRFNNKKDLSVANAALKYFHHKKIRYNVIDCLDKKNCTKLVKYLAKKDIRNIDLGAYQISYYYHTYKDIEVYFDLKKSETIACNYLHLLVNKYGWNWYAIAAYHSRTEKYNSIYQKAIKRSYLKNNIQN